LYAVLNPDARPAKFSVRNAGELERFDKKNVGLNKDSKAPKSGRSLYDTSMYEHSNRGHDFASLKALTDDERYDLIEYLKTL
jgi:hypothetical protein